MLEQSVKFTPQINATEYASNKGLQGYSVYLAELPTSEKNFILVHGGSVIFESQNLEEIGTKIDMIALAEQF